MCCARSLRCSRRADVVIEGATVAQFLPLSMAVTPDADVVVDAALPDAAAVGTSLCG